MAASKSARKEPVARGDRKSVPSGGGRTTARKSVAQRDAGRRAEAKEVPPRQKPLPRVQPTVEVVGPGRGERYPLVPAKALLSAFGRAEKYSTSHPVKWDPSRQKWVVPSATRAGRSYFVWRNHRRGGPLPFYVALECSCEAEQSGSYLVCWHKCAVKLWLNEWFSKRSFGNQLDAVEEGGEEDDYDDIEAEAEEV